MRLIDVYKEKIYTPAEIDFYPEYGVMAAVGTNMNFTEKEVAAIINYERSSWGNNAKKVTEEEIKKVMDFVKVKVSASNQ